MPADVPQAAPDLPLSDVLVVDLSRVLSGPFSTMLLSDLGARVIKVEHPAHGDDTRVWGPPFVGDADERVSTYFLALNRNKESIALDLKDPADLDVLKELLRRADVVVNNFRPGVMDRMGLAPDDLQALNPGLTSVSVTGYGHDGPDAQKAGYDQILQGEAGLMSLTGPDADTPTKVGVPVGDVQAGLLAAVAALAGLHQARRTGTAPALHTSLLAGLVAAHTFQGTRWLIGGETAAANGNAHPTVAPYGAFRARDGQIQIAVGNESLWRRFAPLVGLSAADPRFASNAARAANRPELEALIQSELQTEDCDVWLARLEHVGVPAGRIRSLDQVYRDPQVVSQGLALELDHAVGTITVPGPAIRIDHGGREARREHSAPPRLDEHGDAVRAWLAEPVPTNARQGG